MNKNKKGFTLVELIVGITLSLILMMSVSLFVQSGMQNIFFQQKALKNVDDFNNFSQGLYHIFSLINSENFIPQITSSGVTIKHNKYFSSGGFSYLGTTTGTGIYCDADSETPETTHLFLKSFIPFQEETDGVFNDFLTGTSGNYTSYQKEHIVKDNLGNIIIGKGIFGDNFIEGASGTGIYLNSPTGVAYDGVNILYVSDTLNNRILYWNSTTKTIHKLLDENDGLLEPTGLYYDDLEKSLYIANSGRGEILKYSSKNIITNPNLSLKLTPSSNKTHINKISIDFLGGSTINTSNFSFVNVNPNSSSTNYLTGTTNTLNYYFTDYSTVESNSGTIPILGCTDYTKEFLESDIPKKETRTCIPSSPSNTGSIIKYTGNIYNTFLSGSIIHLTGINGDFTSTGSYYTKVSLLDDGTENYSEYFPYFTQGDDDIKTLDNNTLEILTEGLNYPTGIWYDGGIKYNQFTAQNLSYDSEYDTILPTPISSFTVDETNQLLTLQGKYYRSYNCYNPDEQNSKSFLFKKNLK